MKMKRKEGAGWWHLIFSHGPGHHTKVDEWRYCYSLDEAEDWKEQACDFWDYPVVNIFELHRRPPKKVLERQERDRMWAFSGIIDQFKIMVIPGKKLPKCFHKHLPKKNTNVIVYKPSKTQEAAKIWASGLWSESEQDRESIYVKEHKFYVWIPSE